MIQRLALVHWQTARARHTEILFAHTPAVHLRSDTVWYDTQLHFEMWSSCAARLFGAVRAFHPGMNPLLLFSEANNITGALLKNIATPGVQGKGNLLKHLELEEIAQREAQRKIPNFFAGSIVRVTYRDTMSQKYPTALVGICIKRQHGIEALGSSFIIRNSIEEVGFEKFFHTHSPLITNLEVLRFARRRRAKLYYLRDRPMAVGLSVDTSLASIYSARAGCL
jgi:ribosomal protein L19